MGTRPRKHPRAPSPDPAVSEAARGVAYLESHVIPALVGSYDIAALPRLDNHHKLILWRRERMRARNAAVRRVLAEYAATCRTTPEAPDALLTARMRADVQLEDIGRRTCLPTTSVTRATVNAGCIWFA